MLVKINVEAVNCPMCGKDKLAIGLINNCQLVAVCKACKRMTSMNILLADAEESAEEEKAGSAV